MLSTRYLFAVLLILFGGLLPLVAQEDGDGVPDNCEYRYGEYYQPNVFPRYEPQNRRLLLVDWATSDEIRTLATDLGDTIIQSWSANCQYLAVATGNDAERATVVYDTLTGERIGSVPGAIGAPHRTSWGPGNYLIVERREGAILWDVPRNIQYSLNTGFNTTTYRNFDDLRWDAENKQLIATLSVGGRRVYDLNTGAETIDASSPPGMIALGGNLYPCERYGNPRDGVAYQVSPVSLDYNEQAELVFLRINRYNATPLETLEDGVSALSVRTLGWSAGCRYVAGALMISDGRGDNPLIYDTVIWDVQNKRRVGNFSDAHHIPHPLYFDTAGTHVMVQTRHGAFLWNLETDGRVLVNEVVGPPRLGCYSNCRLRSFHDTYWDAGRDQFLGVPIQQSDTIIAYNIHTGEPETSYIVEGAEEPLSFITSDDSRYLVATVGNDVTMWDRETGAVTSFVLPNPHIQLISPDSRYFVSIDYEADALVVWELANLFSDATPAYRLPRGAFRGTPWRFISNRVVASSSYRPQTIHIETGEVTTTTFQPEEQMPVAYSALPGVSGNGGERGNPFRDTVPGDVCRLATYYNGVERKLYVRNLNTNETTLIAKNISRIYQSNISPDCQFLYANESLFNTDVPYRVEGDGERRRTARMGLWRIATGEKVAEFASGDAQWSPEGAQAILFTDNGDYVFDTASGSYTQIRFLTDTDPSLLERTYWDYDRGVVYVRGCSAAHAIDIATGEERARFTVTDFSSFGCHIKHGWVYGAANFRVLEDGWVQVYNGSRSVVWNVETLEHVYLPQNSRITVISPDRRYVVLGLSEVYVYSFETGALLAEYGVLHSRVLDIAFIDNQKIAVQQWQEDDIGRETVMYDLLSGETVTQ